MSNCNDRYFVQKQCESKWTYFATVNGRGAWIIYASAADRFNEMMAMDMRDKFKRDSPTDKFRIKLIGVRT